MGQVKEGRTAHSRHRRGARAQCAEPGDRQKMARQSLRQPFANGRKLDNPPPSTSKSGSTMVSISQTHRQQIEIALNVRLRARIVLLPLRHNLRRGERLLIKCSYSRETATGDNFQYSPAGRSRSAATENRAQPPRASTGRRI